MSHDPFTPAALLPTLEPFLDSPRWFVAYSGGVDSHVLLHAIASLRTQVALPPLCALHVNHQINPRASAWADHCSAVCAALDIECIVETVRVDAAGIGLEAAARTARYAAFARRVGAGELLLQAHHADDQIETLLLRLLRGSGMAGLAAMPRRRPLDSSAPAGGELLRPLLPFTRGQLVDYARAHALQWIHDDSNDAPALDRNFLRLRVLPLLEERWPAYRSTLERVVDNAADAQQLIREVAAADHAAAVADDGALRIESLLALGAARRAGLVACWLKAQRLPPPSSAQLAQVLALCSARADAEPCVDWAGVEIHRFRGNLHAMRPLPEPPADIDRVWQPGAALALPGLGELRATAVGGPGPRTDRGPLLRADRGPLLRADRGPLLRADRAYRVRNRRGGERCRPVGRAHSQTLKKLLQESAVPPWLRDRLPLIYCADELAAVGDLWICEGFQAEDEMPGWRLEWLGPLAAPAQ